MGPSPISFSILFHAVAREMLLESLQAGHKGNTPPLMLPCFITRVQGCIAYLALTTSIGIYWARQLQQGTPRQTVSPSS